MKCHQHPDIHRPSLTMKSLSQTVSKQITSPFVSSCHQQQNRARKKADSLTKPKWKVKMSKRHLLRESKPALLGGRNPLIASTLLQLTSICLHLRKPNYWAPSSCEEGTCVPSVWLAWQTGTSKKNRRSTNKAQLHIQQHIQMCDMQNWANKLSCSGTTGNNGRNHSGRKVAVACVGRQAAVAHSSEAACQLSPVGRHTQPRLQLGL